MSGLTREIFMDGKAEGIKETYAKIYKEGLINASDAARMLNISVDDFLKLVKEK